MKALTIASLSALALVGVACSESASDEIEQTETVSEPVVETSTPAEDSGFNLDLFEDDGGDNGFNIGFEDDTGDSLSGFDFGDDNTGSLLSDIPTIEAPITPVDEDQLVELPEVPTIDEDEIIRLPE
ncbi:MAG: hypothetical protein AAGJ85_02405 [Pseudomonadota bacterium]